MMAMAVGASCDRGIPEPVHLAMDGVPVGSQLAFMTGTTFPYQPELPAGLIHIWYPVFLVAVVTDGRFLFPLLKKSLCMYAFHVLFVLPFVAARAEMGDVFTVYDRKRIAGRQDVMRSVAGLTAWGLFYALFDGLVVNAQTILFGRCRRSPGGAREMAGTAVHLPDVLVGVRDHVEVTAVAWTHAMN
jgi:hypothetical protein